MWFLLSLITALLTAVSALLNKILVRYWPSTTMVFFSGFVAALFLLLSAPFPEISFREFMLPLLGSVSIAIAASFLQLYAYKRADISLVFPLVNLTPLFMVVTSPLILGEFPALISLPGIIAIVLGAYLLNSTTSGKDWLLPFKLLFRDPGARAMLLVALLWSLGGNFDKMGVGRTSPLFWGGLVKMLTALFSLGLGILRKIKKREPEVLETSPRKFLLFLQPLATIGILWSSYTAYQLTQVVYVISVKRLSTLFIMIFGWLLFKEPIKRRWKASLVMLAGVLWLSFSSM